MHNGHNPMDANIHPITVPALRLCDDAVRSDDGFRRRRPTHAWNAWNDKPRVSIRDSDAEIRHLAMSLLRVFESRNRTLGIDVSCKHMLAAQHVVTHVYFNSGGGTRASQRLQHRPDARCRDKALLAQSHLGCAHRDRPSIIPPPFRQQPTSVQQVLLDNGQLVHGQDAAQRLPVDKEPCLSSASSPRVGRHCRCVNPPPTTPKFPQEAQYLLCSTANASSSGS